MWECACPRPYAPCTDRPADIAGASPAVPRTVWCSENGLFPASVPDEYSNRGDAVRIYPYSKIPPFSLKSRRRGLYFRDSQAWTPYEPPIGNCGDTPAYAAGAALAGDRRRLHRYLYFSRF